MADADRPETVRRFLRAPWWWCALGALLVAWGVADDIERVRAFRAVATNEVLVPAEVLREDRSIGGIVVRYVHPVTDQRLDVSVVVWRAWPDPGDHVEAVASRDDPRSLRLVEDRYPLHANVFTYLPLVVVPALWALARRLHLRATRRLITAHEPAFALTGVVTGPTRWQRRCRLDLYALDAAAGSPPLCTVPLLTTAGVGVGAAVPLEVKGLPRRFGQVVASAAGEILWPATRALRRTGSRRPDHVPVVLRTAERVTLPPSARRPGWSVLALGWPVPALAASILVLALTIAVSGRAARAEADRADVGTPAVGEVVGHESDDTQVVFEVVGGDGSSTVRASAGYASDFPVGTRYPIMLDPVEPGRAHLPAAPYDRGTPTFLVGLAVVGVTPFALRRVGWWWRVRRLWRDREVRVVEATVSSDSTPNVLTLLDSRAAPVATLEAGVAESPSVGHGRTTLLLAGALDPGAAAVLWSVAGQPILPRGPLASPVTNVDPPRWPGFG